jgi:hypothetical protein
MNQYSDVFFKIFPQGRTENKKGEKLFFFFFFFYRGKRPPGRRVNTRHWPSLVSKYKSLLFESSFVRSLARSRWRPASIYLFKKYEMHLFCVPCDEFGQTMDLFTGEMNTRKKGRRD